jgi:hypothetical protein
MPRTGWTPSIVPNGDDQNVYLVVDDFGRNGWAFRETDVDTADLETVILDLLEDQYKDPPRRCLQHLRSLVAGRLRRFRPRAASPLRSANVRGATRHWGLGRPPRRS